MSLDSPTQIKYKILEKGKSEETGQVLRRDFWRKSSRERGRERRDGGRRGEEDAVEGRYFYVQRGTFRSTRERPRDTFAYLAVKILYRAFFAGVFVLAGGDRRGAARSTVRAAGRGVAVLVNATLLEHTFR